METFQLVIIILFIIFIVIPAVIFLGMLGIAAIVASNPPQVPKEVPQEPPPNLKPSPITQKYVCPTSKVCNWASSPINCSAPKTAACTLEHATKECNEVAKSPFIYDTDTEIICETEECKWSEPDPVTKQIKLNPGINCRLDKAREYCEQTGGKIDFNKGVYCIYKNPM